MNSVFEKLGIYDFMGIWAPGAITVTYYLFSFYIVVNRIINESGISAKYVHILLFTAVAYILGVIFHEIGKIIVDCIPNFFNAEIYTLDYREGNYNKKPKNPFRLIKRDFKRNIDSYSIEPKVNFEKALATLRNSDSDIGRINTYHSIYALARGCFVGIIFHILTMVILLIAGEVTVKILWWIIPDVLLGTLFFIRSHRYFVSWIKNTYIQYYFYINRGAKNESD
ncbi:MAG: hypothetical protein ACI4I9_04325 [Porcipelethomonas sp.]